jgi:PhoPQ-activated pathogenicity-related protein
MALECASHYRVKGECVPVGVSPLEFYVHQHDPESTYNPVPMQKLELNGSGPATAFVLNFTSQRWWSDDSLFLKNSSAKGLWRHQLSIVVPRQCQATPKHCGSTAWLYVTGGHNNPWPALTPSDSDLRQAANLAVSSNTITAVLKQVPNQPVIFKDELPHPPFMYPRRERTEDGIIAYGWRRFIDRRNANQTVDAQWLLRLPMTKAVSRAMDAVTSFAVSRLKVAVSDFVVNGRSKRGWTTWTTGLVEPRRAAAIVPVVEDLLSLKPNMERTYMALGGWTFEFADYLYAGLLETERLQSRGNDELAAIVDPYAYVAPVGGGGSRPGTGSGRWRRLNGSDPWLAMPKYVVNAGNDEFFLPGDNHLWWHDGSLPGEKHLLHIPNTDHGFDHPDASGERVYEDALRAYYHTVVYRSRRENFTWRLLIDDEAARVATIEVANASATPTGVAMWAATSDDGHRDWRLFNCRSGPGHNCSLPEADPSEPVPGGPRLHFVPYKKTDLSTEGGRQLWRASVPVPTDGNHTAFVVSVKFASGEHYTSQIGVAPAAYPFAACSRPGGEEGGCDRLV